MLSALYYNMVAASLKNTGDTAIFVKLKKSKLKKKIKVTR